MASSAGRLSTVEKPSNPEVWMTEHLTNLYAMGRDSTEVMAVAFPGFHDIYETSYGYIDARDGSTFDETLARAMDSACPLVQIATWNDHGEGTSIEPTVEFDIAMWKRCSAPWACALIRPTICACRSSCIRSGSASQKFPRCTVS